MKRIHINQHVIRKNQKTGERNPVITVKEGRTNRYAHSVEINGPSRLVYSPDKPLSCGARVWIETESEVVLAGKEGGVENWETEKLGKLGKDAVDSA